MNISPTPQRPTDITLEDLANKKAELKGKIALKKKTIEELSADLFSPLQSTSTGFSLLKNVKTGMAIFNGVVLGLKIMRKFRHFFGRNR